MADIIPLLQARLSKIFGRCVVTEGAEATEAYFPAVGLRNDHRQFPDRITGSGPDRTSAIHDLCEQMELAAYRQTLVVIQEYDEPAIHGHGAYPRACTPVDYQDGRFVFEKQPGTHLFTGTPRRHDGF